MKTLNISTNLKLPLEAVTQTFAWLAKRRVGKTYAASVLAEEFVAAGLPFVALDPTGAWWGLRAAADGKGAGLPVIVIGGRHGDIPLNPEGGKIIADVIVDNPGHYVLDLSLTKSNAEQDRFAADFAERLYRRKQEQRDPMFLFVDEADSFCPQRPYPGQQRMLGAFEAVVRRGGIYGLGVGLISQRASVINKNVLTQTEVMIVLQTTSPQDRAAIKEWAVGHGTKEQVEHLMETVASLQKGEAWVWSPSWLETFKRVNIRARHTFNSSATPKVGERQVEPKRLAEVDLDALKERLAKTIESAKENDPSALKRKVADLFNDNVRLRAELVKRGMAKPAVVQASKVEVKEVPVLSGKDLSRFEVVIARLEALAGKQDGLKGSAMVMANALKAALGQARQKPVPVPSPMLRVVSDARVARGEAHIVSPAGKVQYTVTEIGTGGKSGMSRMLEVLARRHPEKITQVQLATLSGMSPTSGTFTTYLSRMRQLGYLWEMSGLIGLNPPGVDAGQQWLGQAQSREEVLALWKKSLGGTEWKMLAFLLDHNAHDRYMYRQDLAAALSLSPTSGTFTTYLSRLRRNALIEEEGASLRASQTLWPEAVAA